MEDAVTPLPIPERTPPVTTTILRSAFNVVVTKSANFGGMLFSFVFGREGGGAAAAATGVENVKADGRMHSRESIMAKEHNIVL
jgi:hypothetical protein